MDLLLWLFGFFIVYSLYRAVRTIIAGKTALTAIQEKGFRADSLLEFESEKIAIDHGNGKIAFINVPLMSPSTISSDRDKLVGMFEGLGDDVRTTHICEIADIESCEISIGTLEFKGRTSKFLDFTFTVREGRGYDRQLLLRSIRATNPNTVIEKIREVLPVRVTYS